MFLVVVRKESIVELVLRCKDDWRINVCSFCLDVSVTSVLESHRKKMFSDSFSIMISLIHPEMSLLMLQMFVFMADVVSIEDIVFVLTSLGVQVNVTSAFLQLAVSVGFFTASAALGKMQEKMET